ncbi:hypothetical protein ACA910_011315 [Epithemia clementina (nom. ined.)]
MRICILSILGFWFLEGSKSFLLTPPPTPSSFLRRENLHNKFEHASSCLYRSKKPTSSEEDGNDKILPEGSVRFLGRGSDAIVRPGCVLVAPSNEFHHFYRQSAIFVYGMGEVPDGEDDLYVIRGLIIDHPTPFTLAEMMEHNPVVPNNPLGSNFLFRGGDKGQEGVILLHNQKDLGQNEIGMSGIFEGGWQAALESCALDSKETKNFKAFFNYCEFTEQELEDLLSSSEDGDSWASVEVQPSIVLDPDWDRGDAWSRLRNSLKQMNV